MIQQGNIDNSFAPTNKFRVRMNTILYEKELDPTFLNAPYLIYIHAPHKNTYAVYDAVIAGIFTMMKAECHGIGSCIIGEALYVLPDIFIGCLEIPEGNRTYMLIAMGYPKLKYRRTVYRHEPNLKII